MMKKEGGGYDDTYIVVQSTIERGDIKYQKISYGKESIKIPILITREVNEDKEFALKEDKIKDHKNGFSVDCCTFIVFLKDENHDDMLLSIVLAKPVEIKTDDYILHMREDINEVKSNNYYHISLIFWSEINIENPSRYKNCYCNHGNHDNHDNYNDYYTEYDYGSEYLNLYIINIYKKYNDKKNNIKFSRIDKSIAVLDHTEGLGNDHMIHDIHLHSKRYYNRELHVSL